MVRHQPDLTRRLCRHRRRPRRPICRVLPTVPPPPRLPLPRHSRGRPDGQPISLRPPPPRRPPLRLCERPLRPVRRRLGRRRPRVPGARRWTPELPVRWLLHYAPSRSGRRLREGRGGSLRRGSVRSVPPPADRHACRHNLRPDLGDRPGRGLGRGGNAVPEGHGRHGDAPNGRGAHHQRRAVRFAGLRDGLQPVPEPRVVPARPTRRPAVHDADSNNHPSDVPLHCQPPSGRPRSGGREQPALLLPLRRGLPYGAPCRSLFARVPGGRQGQSPAGDQGGSGEGLVRGRVRDGGGGAAAAGGTDGGEPAERAIRHAFLLAGAEDGKVGRFTGGDEVWVQGTAGREGGAAGVLHGVRGEPDGAKCGSLGPAGALTKLP
ncbi:hypothetical protein MUK42_14824 [Musa troglodytarum]|uniref:Uncharacterized protein n=1 Tax=Musa troglodytarum TaxID=320322 RepID=A0A9E7LAP2_9LILI|nr:hypothetical protein MUK42_14824 [Musa troglodytarum]